MGHRKRIKLTKNRLLISSTFFFILLKLFLKDLISYFKDLFHLSSLYGTQLFSISLTFLFSNYPDLLSCHWWKTNIEILEKKLIRCKLVLAKLSIKL